MENLPAEEEEEDRCIGYVLDGRNRNGVKRELCFMGAVILGILGVCDTGT